MAVTRVLIVDDEEEIAALMKHSLERSGDVVAEIASSGDEALQIATRRPPDLMILDLNLPALSGFDVCRILRGRPESAALPIIMVTARTTEQDRVMGLDLGADDYVTKPFSLRELAARVRAVLRRRSTAVPDRHTSYAGAHLTIDFDAVVVTVDGKPVRLTRREFELLEYLLRRRNRVVSRGRLLADVWGVSGDVDTRSVDVHIGRLRSKLGRAGQQIETVVGFGYRFVELRQE